MTIGNHVLLLIVAMAAVTYLPRWFPLFFLSRRELPLWLKEWLDFIPTAILAALILPELVTSGEPRRLAFMRSDLVVAVPTLLFALKTRSLGGTVAVGMALYWLAGILF